MKQYIISVLAIFFAFLPISMYAQSSIGHFGGEITNVQYCTCYYDPAVIITVKDIATNRSIKLKYSPWYSRINLNYNIFSTGVKVIGGSTAGFTTCLKTSSYYCTSDGSADAVIDLFRGVGTTLK